MASLYLAIACAFSATQARAAQARPNLPRLELVVVDQSTPALATDALIAALESSLGVTIEPATQHAHALDLGQLSVLIARQRTTLLWTLPDGRCGLANVPMRASPEQLLVGVAAAAQSMLSAFGLATPSSPRKLVDAASSDGERL
jgi:hypothetical protein